GDANFSVDAGYGGPNFFFWEDWYVDNSGACCNSAGGGWDSNNGGKAVIRYNVFFDTTIVGHGTESGRSRGGRAVEIYRNRYIWDYLSDLDGIRSGTIVAHDNTFEGVELANRGYAMQTYRMIFNYSGTWNGADGQRAWDMNATEA